MPIDPTSFNAAAFLADLDAQADFLNDALARDEVAVFAYAVGVLARAQGMRRVAQDAGMQREHLYRALSKQGQPGFATVNKVLAALGLRLAVLPVDRGA